jgi:hypothetical protein
LYLITIWAVIVPVIVIEGVGAMASFGRSRALVRGHGWHVFGTLVMVYVILLVVDLVLGLIFSALPGVLGSGLSAVISGTLISPFLALVVTLVYYRLSGGVPTPPVPGENYGGFSTPPQGGHYGGFTEPPQGGAYGGFTEPPQPGENYGGYSQTPSDGGTHGGHPQP